MPFGLFGAQRPAPQASAATQPSAGFNPLSLYAQHASRGPLTAAASLNFYKALKEEYKAHVGEKMPLYLKASIRPGTGDIIGTASLERFDNAREGLKEHQRQNLHPTFDGHVNDTTVVGTPKLLGGGAFNKVYKCQFRDKAMPTGPWRDMAVKTAKPQFLYGDATAESTLQNSIGISPQTPRIADRNVATAEVNRMLGTTSVPDAETGFLDGKPVVAMSIAPGTTLEKLYKDEPAIVHEPEFQRQMSDIEVNAYLSANPDTHSGNVMIRAEKQPDGAFANVKLTMIDNDMCFGPTMTNPDQPPKFFETQERTYKSTGLPAYMDARTAKAVKDMDVEGCAKRLEANLDGDEMFAFKSRAAALKDHVTFLEDNNRIVSDWSAFTNENGEPLAGGNFFDGTLAMAGVQSGLTRNGEPVFQPRSLIMRDMAQHGGTFCNVVPDQHRGTGISSTWSQVSGKIVPPTGRNHGTVPPVVPEATDHGTPASETEAAYQRTPASETEAAYQRTPASDTEAAYQRTPASDTEAAYQRTPASGTEAPYQRTPASDTEAPYQRTPASDTELAYQRTPAPIPGRSFEGGLTEAPYATALRIEDAPSVDARRETEAPYATAFRIEGAPVTDLQEVSEAPYATALRNDPGTGTAAPGGWAAAKPGSPRPNGSALGSRPAPDPVPGPSFDLREEQDRYIRV